MMSHCLVRGCRNGSERTDSSVAFYPFPVEREAAERWASLCGVSGQECSQLLQDLEHGGAGRYQLCSLHFEQRAFETNPEDATRGVILRQGAEPTLLLSPAQNGENNAQVNTFPPVTQRHDGQTPPSAPPCPSCALSSKAAQVPDCKRSPNVQFSVTESRPQVSHCTTKTMVVSPRPGVNQIVLNFCEQGKGLTLENVSTESAPQCPGGAHCPQRAVKQVVLIFLDHPCESVTPTPSTSSSTTSSSTTSSSTTSSSMSSQECPLTLSSSTQTEERDGKSETDAQVHPERPVQHPSSPRHLSRHASTQTDHAEHPQLNRETRDCPQSLEPPTDPTEVTRRPGEQNCPSSGLSSSKSREADQQTPQSCPEPVPAVSCGTQSDVTGRQAEVNYQPPVSDGLQTPPEYLDKELDHRSCAVPPSTVDPGIQAQLIDYQAPRHLRKCDPRPEDPPQAPEGTPCRQFCLDPSIKQYVGDLLGQHNVSPPPCVPAAASSSSSSPCSCMSAQRRVKQIVLNFVEQDSAVVNEEVPAPGTTSDLLSPVVPSRQHQETQTRDYFLPRKPQRPKENPEGRPPRPPKSRSCPPLLNGHMTLSLTQEEEISPHPPVDQMPPCPEPQDQRDRLKIKVTFEDVAIYFSKEEWELLGTNEKDLYREVTSDNYRSLVFLGFLQEKPDLVSRIENKEENLWVGSGSRRRIRLCEDDLCFLDQNINGVHILAKDNKTSSCPGTESAESSSHLGALMRLVNEIPGFLLGSSVTDESSSPGRSIEDHGNNGPFLEVKTEENSPTCSPAFALLPLSETPEITAGLGAHRNKEQSNGRIVAKAEKTEVAVSPSSRYGTPVSHPPVSPSRIKSDPGSSRERVQGGLQIKQEEFPADCSPARNLIRQPREISPVRPIISHLPRNPLYSPGTRDRLILDPSRRSCSGGGSSLSRSTAASSRNPSVSPAFLNDGTHGAGLGDLKIKIKQEDSGSERDLVESPVYARRVYHPPASSSTALQAERDHWRLAASPLRSSADAAPGSSPLHRLVNCLKEITAGRPRPYSSTLSTTRWGTNMSRVCAEASSRANSSYVSRDPRILAPQPNPFTVAVTNGAAQLRGIESKTFESPNTRSCREESHVSSVPLTALGKCLEKIHSRASSGQNVVAYHNREEPRRTELVVKRSHSDDLPCRPGVFSGAKRPALEVSSSSRVVSSSSPAHRDLWRPPEELPRAPSEDYPIGNSHLMSVMNCVRKIPGCRPSPSIHASSTADPGRTCTQGVGTEAKDIKVKQERDENPSLEASRQWIQPPQSPDVLKQSGSLASNVHLTGLMRLMEEIPCTESSNSSRAMYSIAVGHSLARRLDRSNYLSSCNDDPGFQAELNDGTIASGDSVYSDDTSWSSENVDPSYSAIGGLQRVVSEFAELGSVSPLVAVSAPPAPGAEGIGLKKPKEALSASTSRLNECVRQSPRHAAGSAASTCSAENGEAAFAAIRGLQKVVRGFVEQECVSPITAVRINTPNTGLRDLPGKKTGQEEEAASLHLQDSSPAPVSRFLCDTGKWLPESDSSYSALSGLQKVVNGFSEMSCVSPFSAVSTPVSEGTMEVPIQRRSDAPAQDLVSCTLSGQKYVINGVPDASCLSPLTLASNVSSESDAGPTMKRRYETLHKCLTKRQRPNAIAAPSHIDRGRPLGSSSSHFIDLTQEEDSMCSKNKTVSPEKERKQRIREGPSLCRPPESPGNRPENLVGNRVRPPGSSRTPCNQLIDLTEEEETPTKPKEAARKSAHSGFALNPPLAEKHKHSINLPKARSGGRDEPLDPGASASNRAAVPVINEHLSGLEKLLKGVPTFTPGNRPSGQAWSGNWWFKSTSSHET
ncbi:uncharacterized protein LOC142652234 isoform X3 [Rhinoderma darwinii]|uniref:uncharacterized protein LOC142652234 isoform X3 n=1 Tax=Rhinoderma darwinii TaxID=43563 RepID=UPI003F661F98